MAEPAISKIDSYQYPAAHLGHLTENQQQALDKFKLICEEKGYYRPAGKEGKKHASHDDETMLRYLRARKFDPQQGFTQFKATEEWRKENRLEEYYSQVDINEFDAARRLYPQWTGRRDKRGIPVYLFEVAHLNSKNISSYQASLLKNDKSPAINPKSKVEPKMMRLFALYESLIRFIFPLCSSIKDRPHPETPVSQSNNIVDISRVGLRQFWNLKLHMQEASLLATAHYPETLDRIFVIGAPSFFPTVWSWIKRWFDPITVSKVFILSPQDMLPTLTKYIDIENIPKKYGGKLDFEFGNMPMLDPAIASALSFPPQKTLPIGPIKWRELPNGAIEAVAVGTNAGKPREEVVATIQTSFAMIHGISRQNTSVDWASEQVKSTTGTATQPTEGDPNYGKELADADTGSGTATPPEGSGAAPPPPPSAPAAIDLAVRSKGDAHGDHSAAGANIQPASDATPREGTSAVKAEQQQGTHAAAGATQDKTPHVVDFGGGDKAAVMDPTTVGQARKDTQLPEPQQREEEPAPSQQKGIVAQASDAVSSATGAVSAGFGAALHAVGLTGEGKSGGEPKAHPETEKDKAGREAALAKIEIPKEKVEEYLKNQSVGKTT